MPHDREWTQGLDEEPDPGGPVLELSGFELPAPEDLERKALDRIGDRIGLGNLIKLYAPIQLQALSDLFVTLAGSFSKDRTKPRRP